MSEIYRSQNTVKGWEIVPHVLREIVPYVPIQRFLRRALQNEKKKKKLARLHAQLFSKLKNILGKTWSLYSDNTVIVKTKKKRRSTKKGPKTSSETIPNNNNNSNINKAVAPPDTGNSSNESTKEVRRRKKRNSAPIVMSRNNVSIVLPKDFPNVDIDKLPLPEHKRNLNGGNYKRRFTFSQRLQGWDGKRTKRDVVYRTDPYYRHIASDVTIRSYVGLVNFLLYEEIPGLDKKIAKAKEKEKRKRERSGNSSTRKPRKSRKNSKKSDNNNNNNKNNNKKKKVGEKDKFCDPFVETSKRIKITAEESKQFLATARNCSIFSCAAKNESKGKKGDESDIDSERTISGQISSKRKVTNIIADDEADDDATSTQARAQINVNAKGKGKLYDVAINVDINYQQAFNTNTVADKNNLSDEVRAFEIENHEEEEEETEPASTSTLLGDGTSQSDNGQTIVIADNNECQMEAIFNSLSDLFPNGF